MTTKRDCAIANGSKRLTPDTALAAAATAAEAGSSQADFERILAGRGVRRRDFLKFCGAVAAALGLSQARVPRLPRLWKKA